MIAASNVGTHATLTTHLTLTTHTMTRRRLVAALAAAPALAACGGGGSAARPASGGGGALAKNATLEAWVAADARAAWQKLALEDYNKEKGLNLTVNWTKQPNGTELANKLVVTLAAGSGSPDMADVLINEMGKLLKNPSPPLVAFNDLLKGREADFFMGSFADPWSVNGKYYALGNELNACVLAYRHDIFQQAGIKPPIKTWDEAMDIGRRLSAVCPDGLYWVAPGPIGPFHMLAIQAGGGYWEKGNKLAINHAANARAMQYLVDLTSRFKAASLEAGSQRIESLQAGRAAADVGPAWKVAGNIQTGAPDTTGKWAVQPMPQWSASGKPVTTSQGGTGMAVLKDGKHRDLAADFVLWEHGSKAVLHDFKLRQVWPTYKKVYDDPALNEPIPWFGGQRLGPVLRDAAATMLPFYQGVWWPELAAAGKHITAGMRGEKPVRQALDEAQAEARAAIEAAGGKLDADGTLR
jgi:arabinosaccharide transport system substrate-binding protein